MTPSAYRRETQAIEAHTLRIRRIREEMLAALARLDDESASALFVISHHDERLADKEGC